MELCHENLHYTDFTPRVVTEEITPRFLSGVQKGAGGGDEGEDGDRSEDEEVPPLDEERGPGPADLHRRLTARSSVFNMHICLSADIQGRRRPHCVEG